MFIIDLWRDLFGISESWRDIKDPEQPVHKIGDVIETEPGEFIRIVEDTSWLRKGSYIGLRRGGMYNETSKL